MTDPTQQPGRCETCGKTFEVWGNTPMILVSLPYEEGKQTPIWVDCVIPNDCPHAPEQAEPDAPTRYLSREESAAMDKALRSSVTVISDGTPADVEAAAPTVDDLSCQVRVYGTNATVCDHCQRIVPLHCTAARAAASDMVLVERDVVKTLADYLESLSELFEAGSDEWARLLDRTHGS